MPTHIALLRGINVGGHNKVPMAELRQVVASLGHGEVATYIQSGNVIFTPSHSAAPELASELEAAIAATFSVRTPVVVLSRDELAEVIRANPYRDEPNPKFVHGVFLPAEPDDADRKRVAAALELVAGQGSRDEAVFIGRTLYLHTPDGFGTSELARQLMVKKSSSPLGSGTARNWSTVARLLALCGGPAGYGPN